jgi:hypothetical protein
MAGKISKTKKQNKTVRVSTDVPPRNGSQRAAQILFAIFAIILILSMVLSAVSKF